MENPKKPKVLLVGSEDEENLSIRYLAAVLEKDGHEVSIAPCSNNNQISQVLKEVNKFKPDLIGISIAFQSLADMFFDLVFQIRQIGYKGHITVGGHFPTFEFRKILETQSGIDSVVRFEGEQVIVELANCVVSDSELSSVNNLVYRANNDIHENKCIYKFQILDELPFPKRYKNQERLGEKFSTLVTSRGCWHSSCLYCCIGAFHSRKKEKFALRSPENIAKEIGELYHKKGVRLFQFHDDNFMARSKKETVNRLLTLKKAIESENIDTKSTAFLIKARPDTIDDEVASAMKDLGVVGVFLGIENASESGLKNLIRGVNLNDIHQAIDSLKKYGIILTFNLLLFHPRATIEEIDKNISFLKNNLNFPFDFGRAEVVAGSPLERMLINENKLLGSWPHWNYIIDDELVENMFKINLRTFRRKDSPYSDLMHFTIALGYGAYTLKKLHSGQIAYELFSEANELILEVNSFILRHIEKMRSAAVELPSEEKINEFYEELSSGCKKYLQKIKQLEDKLMRLQISERAFQIFGIKSFVQEIPVFKSIFRLS